VQVLQHEDQRLRLGQPREQRADQLEEIAAPGVGGRAGRPELGQQAGELVLAALEDGRPLTMDQLAEGGGERPERQALLAELEALPVSTWAPSATAERQNSSTRRVLPTPASPPTSTVDGSALRVRFSASRSAARSACRPIRTLLLACAVTMSSMPRPYDTFRVR
jgi:hypothetical protein